MLLLVAPGSAAVAACSFDQGGLPGGELGGDDDVAGGDDAGVSSPGPGGDATPDPFCTPGEPGVVACWTFEPDDTTGAAPTLARDGSGHGNDVMLEGAAAAVGVVGAGLGTGAGVHAWAADSVSLDPRHALTIEAWVRVDRLPATRAWVLDNQGQYGLGITAAGSVRCAGAGGVVTSTTGVTTGAWTHVACVFDGVHRNMTAYLDGRAAGAGAVGEELGTTFTDGVVLGGDSPCAAAPCPLYLDGAIDQVRVWNVPRPAAALCAAAGHETCP